MDKFKKGLGDGLEIAGLQAGMNRSAPGNPNPDWKPSPKEIFERKTSIMRAVAQTGKPEEIPKVMEALSPYMEVSSTDPLMSLLIPRLNNSGGEKLGVREVLEIIKLGNELRGPSQQPSDPTTMANVIASSLKTGAELASRNNGSDPVAAFNQGIQTITPILEKLSETQRLAFEGQIAQLRNELEQKDPEKYFQTFQKYSEMFGGHPPESAEVQMHKLHSLDAERERAYRLETERWRNELQTKAEDRKAKQQSQVIGQITSSLERVFESPVAAQLGKQIGGKIGVSSNPISEARTQAAQNQLQNPMEERFSHLCPKCKKTSHFSRADLVKIESSGGRWVCSCGEAYTLRGDKRPPGPGPGSSTF